MAAHQVLVVLHSNEDKSEVNWRRLAQVAANRGRDEPSMDWAKVALFVYDDEPAYKLSAVYVRVNAICRFGDGPTGEPNSLDDLAKKFHCMAQTTPRMAVAEWKAIANALGPDGLPDPQRVRFRELATVRHCIGALLSRFS
ncbi:MAG: hypothetical protein KC731_09445 [Myxococcales bacterium]|nr:hypothetical protein [Myxococcales bacterium]